MGMRETPPPEADNASERREFTDPLPLEELLELAEVDETDLEVAIAWWEENASPRFKTVLDEDVSA